MIFRLLCASLAILSQWSSAAILQLKESATVKRFPPFYSMNGISAMETVDSDIYVTTSTIEPYSYYFCHSSYQAHKRLEVMRINATALADVSGEEGFAIVYTGLNCTGTPRAFKASESMCYSYFPNTHTQLRYGWHSVYVPPGSTLRLDHRSCNGGNAPFTDVHNDGKIGKCYDKSAIAPFVNTHHMMLTKHHGTPSSSSIYVNRAIVSQSFFDSILQIHSQGNKRIANYVQRMRIVGQSVYILTFNRYRCQNYPSVLIKMTRDLNLLDMIEFTGIGTYNAMDNTRYGVDFVADGDTITVIFSHNEEAPVAMYNASDLSLMHYVVFEEEVETFQGDNDGQQDVKRYISSFTHALKINSTRMWLFVSDGNILVYDPSVAFRNGAPHNASYTLVPFEEGTVTSVELKENRVDVLIGLRLFMLDKDTAKVIPFNEDCGMRAKEFSPEWDLSGPFVQHPYTGFGYLFPNSGSIEHIALRNMDVVESQKLTVDDAYASYYWRYHSANIFAVTHANVSAIAVKDNLLIAGTNMMNYNFQPPLLVVVRLGGCAAGRAGAFCSTCGRGTYTDRDGMASCLACEPGRYTNDEESTRCQECPLGFFSRENRSHHCMPCEFGEYGDERGQSSCNTCPIDTYHMQRKSQSQSDCLRCALGKIAPQRGSSRCDDCPLGKYKSRGDRGTCSACPPGMYRNKIDGTVCEGCPAGKFASHNGTEECTDCAPGSHTEEFMRRACFLCPRGRFSVHDHGGPHEACEGCAVGFYNTVRGSPGNSACKACDKGKHATNDEPGATSEAVCRKCPMGTYGNGADSACTACKEGRISLNEASREEDDCTPCREGTFWTSGDSPCTVCPPNTYQPFMEMKGSSSCTPCAKGSVAPNSGNARASNCSACPRGAYASETHCALCPMGMYNPNVGESGFSSCTPCEVGYFGTTTGASHRSACEGCPIGKEALNTDPGAITAAVCQTCPAGKYGVGASALCEMCKEGRVVLTKGSGRESDCALCPRGTFWVAVDRKCIRCPPNTYQPFPEMKGAASCTICASGKIAPELGNTHASNCTMCATGRYAYNTECKLCPAGTYNDGVGTSDVSACVPCAVGYYGELTGASASSDCKPCPPGREALNTNTGATTDAVCQTCTEGTFGAGASDPCERCKEGKVVTKRGADKEEDCDPCQRGYFWTSSDKECSPCPPNTYQPFLEMRGGASCIACAPGTVAPEHNNTSPGACVACTAGFYTRGSGCDACPRGTYSESEGASSEDTCVQCPVGRYSNVEGAHSLSTSCATCPPGRVGKKKNKNAQEPRVSVNSACEMCHPNSYSEAHDGICMPCDPGRVAPEKGNAGPDACVVCGPGTFAEGTRCEKCGQGKFSEAWEATSSDTCEICPVGRYGSAEGSNGSAMCIPCHAGRYGNADVIHRVYLEESCAACDPGFVSSKGDVSCVACSPGQTSARAETTCEACEPGTYTDAPGLPECMECPANKVSNDDGSMACEACNTNMEPNEGKTECVCSVNFFDDGSGTCKPCPRGASCPTLNTTTRTLITDPGHWRESADSLQIRMCNEHYACAGGVYRNHSDDLCREGHRGALCEVCKVGYAKTKGLCAMCPPNQKGLNIFVTALAPLAASVILFGLIRTANPKEGEQNDMFSGISKISASFAQVYSICAAFDVKYPPIISNLFKTMDYINPTISFYSAQCSMGLGFYDKLWLYLLMPIVYVFIMTSILKGLSQKYGGDDFIRKWFATSIVVGLFIAYPTTIKALMRSLSCDKVGEKFYISTDYQIECYDDKHNMYSFLSATALVLYGIGIPLNAFVILYRYRNRLYEPQAQRLRFLFHGYRLYYWEFVVLARKVVILSMSVFLFRRQSVRYQTVVASWAIQVALYVHLKLVPFDRQTEYGRLCDRLEWSGLIAVTAVLNSGTIFGTSQDNYTLGLTENVILVLVAAVNVVVFALFAFHLLKSGAKKFIIKAGMLCGCIPPERPSPRTLSRRRKSFMGKFVYGTKENDFELELASRRSETRLQIDETLRVQRRKGSRVEELERINTLIAQHYKDQSFAQHKYTQIIEQLRAYVAENAESDPSVLELYDLFLSEQTRYSQNVCCAVMRDLDDDLYATVVDHAVRTTVAELVNAVVSDEH